MRRRRRRSSSLHIKIDRKCLVSFIILVFEQRSNEMKLKERTKQKEMEEKILYTSNSHSSLSRSYHYIRLFRSSLNDIVGSLYAVRGEPSSSELANLLLPLLLPLRNLSLFIEIISQLSACS